MSVKKYRRPTYRHLIFGKFRMAIYPQAVVRSTSCLVLGLGFRGRRIERRYSNKSKMAAGVAKWNRPMNKKPNVA